MGWRERRIHQMIVRADRRTTPAATPIPIPILDVFECLLSLGSEVGTQVGVGVGFGLQYADGKRFRIVGQSKLVFVDLMLIEVKSDLRLGNTTLL